MPEYFIGLMSGTSLDGVDGVLVSFDAAGRILTTESTAYVPFPAALQKQMLALQAPTDNELHLEALAARAIARLYAECVEKVLAQSNIPPSAVRAIGAHGQTIRHRPEAGYTWQTIDASLLAELTGLDVVTDFRSRDIAAGGQGAPLVPAFHAGVFGLAGETRVVVNLGGIANISILRADGEVSGFDTGPANVLMDLWASHYAGQTYDKGGALAQKGRIDDGLLAELLAEPYFALPAPKSTGRDLFNWDWLQQKRESHPWCREEDLMATLAELTARTVADDIARHAPETQRVLVCGGGAYNSHLMNRLHVNLFMHGIQVPVESTQAAGVPPNQVEALAFAWLARQFTHRQPGNLPAVTGARGPRVLGALYPA